MRGQRAIVASVWRERAACAGPSAYSAPDPSARQAQCTACTAHRHTRKQYSTTVHIIGRNTLHPVGDEERKSAEPSTVYAHHPLSASSASKHYNVAITQPAARPATAQNTADACRAYQGSRVSGGTRRTAARRRMRSAGGKASPRSHRRGTARCAVPWYPQARPISPYESRRAVRRS